jgi:hypothetical protein
MQMTVDFSQDIDDPKVTPWYWRSGVPFPFAIVPDRDHSSLGVYCLGMDADWVNQAIDVTVAIVHAVLTLAGLVAVAIGLGRKLYNGR